MTHNQCQGVCFFLAIWISIIQSSHRHYCTNSIVLNYQCPAPPAVYLGVCALNIYCKIHYWGIKYLLACEKESDDLYLVSTNCLGVENVWFLPGGGVADFSLRAFFVVALYCLSFRHPFPYRGWLPVLWRLTLSSICLCFVYKPYSLSQFLPPTPKLLQSKYPRCSPFNIIAIVTGRRLLVLCLFKQSLWPER